MKQKICLVSSSGGHLYKTFLLQEWWSRYDRFWATPINKMSSSLLTKEKIFPTYSPDKRTNLLNLIKNTILAIKIIKQEKPNMIFSTGTGVALPFFIIGKIFKIKTIFMETFIFINQPTLIGKIIYRLKLADIFLVQNKQLLKKYPQAKYWGSVI